MDSEKKEIIDGLRPLFEKAEKESLWFYSSYQQLWFSPQELREEHSKGRYMWGAVNWHLRDPYEKLSQLENKVVAAIKIVGNFKRRINNQ